MNISDKIKLIRKEFKLSQKELADMIGVTQSSVYYWEKGTRNPKLEQLLKICQKTGVSMSFMGLSRVILENGETDVYYSGDAQELFSEHEGKAAFLNYLNSLGYEFIHGTKYNAPYYEIGMIQPKNTNIKIPLTLSEYESLEQAIENQIEIELYRLRKSKDI